MNEFNFHCVRFTGNGPRPRLFAAGRLVIVCDERKGEYSMLIFLALIVSSISVTTLYSQTPPGEAEVLGSVFDSSGAVIPGAHVVLSSEENESRLETETNASGLFILRGLRPGSYDLGVSAEGFQTESIEGLLLEKAQSLRVNIELKIGSDVQGPEDSTFFESFRRRALLLLITTLEIVAGLAVWGMFLLPVVVYKWQIARVRQFVVSKNRGTVLFTGYAVVSVLACGSLWMILDREEAPILLLEPAFLSANLGWLALLTVIFCVKSRTRAPTNPVYPVSERDILVANVLSVADPVRSKKFYTEVLGGMLISPKAPCIIKLSNSWITLAPADEPTPDGLTVGTEPPQDRTGTSPFLSLRVPDIQAYYRDWKEKGATFLGAPVDHGGWETTCKMTDPDGYVIEVVQASQKMIDRLREHARRVRREGAFRADEGSIQGNAE